MQDSIIDKKQQLKTALAEITKQERGDKSLFKFCSENDLPISVVSQIERGLKDPQLTTLFKLAEACSLTPAEFVEKIWKKLPSDFSMIEK